MKVSYSLIFVDFWCDKTYLPRTSKFLDFKGEDERAEASLLSNADIEVGSFKFEPSKAEPEEIWPFSNAEAISITLLVIRALLVINILFVMLFDEVEKSSAESESESSSPCSLVNIKS